MEHILIEATCSFSLAQQSILFITTGYRFTLVSVSEYFYAGECLKSQWEGDQLSPGWVQSVDDDLTVEKCLNLCKLKKYAGLGNGRRCYCGDQLRYSNILPDSWVEF